MKTKEEIVEILNSNGLSHYPETYHGCNGLFISESDSKCYRIYQGMSVTMRNKDICRVCLHEIIYIEDRKSVLYLIDGKNRNSLHNGPLERNSR